MAGEARGHVCCWLTLFLQGSEREGCVQGLVPSWGALGKAQFWLGANGKMAHLAWDIARTGHMGLSLVAFFSQLAFLHVCVGVTNTPMKAENHPTSWQAKPSLLQKSKK